MIIQRNLFCYDFSTLRARFNAFTLRKTGCGRCIPFIARAIFGFAQCKFFITPDAVRIVIIYVSDPSDTIPRLRITFPACQKQGVTVGSAITIGDIHQIVLVIFH